MQKKIPRSAEKRPTSAKKIPRSAEKRPTSAKKSREEQNSDQQVQKKSETITQSGALWGVSFELFE